MKLMTVRVVILLILNLGFMPIITIHAQTVKDTTALSEIVLLSTQIKSSLQNKAASVAVLNTNDFEQTEKVTIASSLNKIPGVYMQQGALNTNRITIRGIGARSQFSTNRVKAYFEEIPLTDAEGETVIDDIDVETIDKVEIIKGPNDVSYGSGLGGVISMYGKGLSKDFSYAKSESVLGSYKLFKQIVTVAHGFKNASVYANFSNVESDGFRENSEYDRKSLNLHSNYRLGEASQLTFIGIFTSLKAFIPSSINENDFAENPEIAAPNWAAAKGFESFDKLLLGLGFSHKITDNIALKSSVFFNHRDAYEPRPFDILDENKNGFGFRAKLNWESRVFSFPIEMSLGSELLFEEYTYSLIENLYQSTPNPGSIPGNQFAKVNQRRNYHNVFLQAETQLSKSLVIEKGISFNTTRYSLKDVFNTDSNRTDSSYNFESVWSPRLGISYKIAPGKNIYASVSKGFSIPSVAETLTPEGEINTDLKSETGINYELGLKMNWFSNAFYTEVVLYALQIDNLLVARRIAEDQYVGINAGESSHLGMEVVLNYRWYLNKDLSIHPFFSAAFNDFEFKDFVDFDNDYSGNKLTGVPDYQWSVGAQIKTNFCFSFNTVTRNTGKIPLNDANTIYGDSYSVTDIKLTYHLSLSKKIQSAFFAGINNLFDEHYAASVLPNAVGFGTALPRYFYPGNPRSFFAGMGIKVDL